jgi:hypothetical protein
VKLYEVTDIPSLMYNSKNLKESIEPKRLNFDAGEMRLLRNSADYNQLIT